MVKRTRARAPRAKRLLLNAVLLAASGFAALGLAEVLLRLIPIPGIIYNSFYYDPLTGGGMYPGTTQIYRSARNEVVKRHVNGWGFLDVEHERNPRPGTRRIGFFGDSFTEARQVPIDSTFFRRIEVALDGKLHAQPPVETLAFGVSGRSTLQSYLECTRWMEAAHLDDVVYVFVENDPVDQVRSLKHSPEIPYPVLSGDTFVVDNSFQDLFAYKTKPLHRTFQFLKAHSLVVSTLETRIKFLRRHGIKMAVTKQDMTVEGAHVAKVKEKRRFQDDSDSLYVYTRTVLERVLDRWREDVVGSGRRFIILYIPAQPEMDKAVAEQDSWLGWLIDYGAAHDVPFVNLTPALVAAHARGTEVFYDHFTPAGHRISANEFVAWYTHRPDETTPAERR